MSEIPFIIYDLPKPVGGVNWPALEAAAATKWGEVLYGVQPVNGAIVRFVFNPSSGVSQMVVEAFLAAHDASVLTLNQRVIEILEEADVDARTIPDFMTWTPAEAATWIDTTVTDLATAKMVLRKMAQDIAVLNAKVFAHIRAEME